MLSVFRSGGASKLLVGGIAATIIVVFALEFRQGKGAGGPSRQSDCSVEVNGRCVPSKEFESVFGLAAYRAGELKSLQSMGIPEKVMEGLVERELLRVEAERLGIGVSEDAANRELIAGRAYFSLPVASALEVAQSLQACTPDPSALPYQFVCDPTGTTGVRLLDVKASATGSFDFTKYERVIRHAANRSPKEFKEMQRRELQAERVRQLVRSRVEVSEQEAWELYVSARSTATATVAQLRRDWFARFAVQLSDEQVAAWGASHPDEVKGSWESEKDRFPVGGRWVREIRLRVPGAATDTEKGDLRKKLEAAKERLAKGDKFEQVAREVSDGDEAGLGGVIGVVGDHYGVGSEELAKAIQGLEVGKVSEIVETPRGYHLVLVEKVLTQEDAEKSGRDLVTRRLALRFQADDMVRGLADRLIAGAAAAPDLKTLVDGEVRALLPKETWVDAALALEGAPKVEDSRPFPRRGRPVENALMGTDPAADLFALDKPGAVVPKALDTTEGVAILQLKEKKVATKAMFDVDKAELVERMRAAKGWEALAEYVAGLRKRAEAAKKIRIDEALLASYTGKKAGGDAPSEPDQK